MRKIYNLLYAVDSHGHGRDLEQKDVMTVFQFMKETLENGVGIICFMPNTSPSIDNCKTLEEYIELIKKAEAMLDHKIKGYVWGGLTDTNHDEVIKMLYNDRVVGVKVYPLKSDGKPVTTGTVGIKDWSSLEKLLQMMKDRGINKSIAGHWEDPELGHSVKSECSKLREMIKVAFKFPEFRFYACHISSIEGAMILHESQKLGLQIMIEFCTHHLWFSSDEVDVNNPLFKCLPPIRGTYNRDSIRNFIKENYFNPLICISTDSASHSKWNPSNGIASHQHMIQILLTLNSDMNIPENSINNLISYNAANFLCLPVQTKTTTWEYFPHQDNKKYNKGEVDNAFHECEFMYRIKK